MFDNLKADTERYLTHSCGTGLSRYFRLVFLQEYWAVVIYRYGKWAMRVRIPVIGWILRIVYFIGNKIISILSGVEIWLQSNVGKGLFIGHYGGVIIVGDVGEYCSIAQQVVIGYKGAGKSTRTPVLGNHVFVGAGAKIIGGVTIGDHAVIGANAVVTHDIPAYATAVGVPAKVIKINPPE